MTTRPFLLALALIASLICAQAAAAQPITLQVTSARTVTSQPDPVELTGTISLAPNNSGTGTPVTGTGTAFSTELHIGDLIKPYTAPGAVPRWLSVLSIGSDTSMRVTQPGAGGSRYNGPAVNGVKFSTLPALKTITKGDPVTTFKYLVNQEDTDNNTQPASACQPSGPSSTLSSCLWTSIRHLSGSTNAAPGPYNPATGFQGLVPDSSPVVTSGDQADFANGGTINLPAGKYMISFVADGHSIDGAHFTTDNSGTVKVVHGQAQPFDLPLATLRVQVFNDNASTNGQWDEGDETYDATLNRAARMPGFTAHLGDVLGEVTTDWYGNPLCTTYRANTAPGRTGYELDSGGKPIILARGGQCVSNMGGEITVPNMGPDRYAVTVLAPAKTVVTPRGLQPTCRNKDWVKTTTLEGGPDWDTWIQPGATGYDTEFLHSGEPTPWTPAGFVCPRNEPNANPNNVGTVIGRVMKARVYYPSQGGLPYNGTDGAGYSGTKTDGPISRPWVSLASLQGGDVATAVVRGNPDGTFTIPRVPPGDYMVSVWDEPLNHIIDSYNLTVRAHQTTNIGDAMLSGWFAELSGTVFNDLNENGRQDPGEPGIPGFPVVIKTRNNSIEDQGSQISLTDIAGHYNLNQAYPLNQFNVLEAYADGWKTTGVTYQTDNQPTPTTQLGAGVDVSFLPIIGLSGRLDWGVKPYTAGDNGGIVGTVSYGTTRNEVDPSQAAVEDYQPGIPGLQVDLFKPVACDANTPAASCSPDGYVLAADGSYALGDWINRYQTESWQRPKNCTARTVTGDPLVGEQALPRTTDPLGNPIDCLEAPMMGIQFGGDDPFNSPKPDANFFSSVDGNYGFGDAWTTPGGRLPDGSPDPANTGSGSATLTPGDYIVKVEIPDDPIQHRPLYTPTREEDVNVFSGDSFKPAYPPPPCVGALHTVHVTNQDFIDAGGSPFDGQQRPLCDAKLVPVRDGKSIAPGFELFTDVPVPGKFWGLVNDNLNVSIDPKATLFGEIAGIGNAPVGIYDFTDRLVDTVHTDPNGFFTSLVPSTSTYNCPLPAGPCPNVYRVVGNDPGQPSARNLDYHSEFDTISANFQAWPGLMLPVDTANTAVGTQVQSPGSNVTKPVQCLIAGTTPQLYAVSAPYGNPGDQIVIKGLHFGATAGRLTLDGTTIPTTAWSDTSITFTIPANLTPGQKRLAIVNTASTPDTSSLNGLALHILGTGYRPQVIEAGPDMWTLIGSPANLRFRLGTNGAQSAVINAAPGGFTAAQLQAALTGPAPNGLGLTGVTVTKTSGGNFRIAITGRHSAQVLTASTTSAGAAIRNFDSLNPNADYGTHAVQAALDAAAGRPNASGPGQHGPEVLVVVYPNTDSSDPYNPESAYYENLIMHSPVKLQGVGPGGAYADGTDAAGTVIDGSAYQADAQSGTDWFALANSLAFDGNQNIYEGETLMVVANDGGAGSGTTRVAQFRSNFPASIDGLKIMGGRHDGFPNNRDPVTGAPNGQTATVETQGGGIYVNAQAHSLQITNDVIDGNSGAYGGGIRLGTPQIGSNQNDNIRIAFNRIDHNGGTNLAGAVGVFAGATNYRIDHNTLCGNNSAEYGGAISHFGLSNGGKIDHNRIWFNRSYDEGGAVFVGSELPVNPNTMPVGAGAVDITENVMQANLANDDGGAVRLLMVDGRRRSQTGEGNQGTIRLYDDRINILNNTIANNISTHEGGGIALDDSTNVVVANNTVAHNITTATAMTSTGQPAPAGLSTAGNSFLLQAELDKRYGANTRPLFSKPTLFNNVFTDNRAGSWSLAQGLHGIGQAGDASPINLWDVGLADNLCNNSGAVRSCLSPLNNRFDTTVNNTANIVLSATNLVGTPVNFVDDTYRVSVNALPWRGYPQFVGAVLVAVDRPIGQMGNYHLAAGANSPVDNGRASAAAIGGPSGTVNAPAIDIDDQARTNNNANPNDVGSDERQ